MQHIAPLLVHLLSLLRLLLLVVLLTVAECARHCCCLLPHPPPNADAGAAGGIALIVSGLKALAPGSADGSGSADGNGGASASGQWVSPARVRRAVEATCAPLGGDAPDAVLTYGRGLLQVRAAALPPACM